MISNFWIADEIDEQHLRGEPRTIMRVFAASTPHPWKFPYRKAEPHEILRAEALGVLGLWDDERETWVWGRKP